MNVQGDDENIEFHVDNDERSFQATDNIGLIDDLNPSWDNGAGAPTATVMVVKRDPKLQLLEKVEEVKAHNFIKP